MLYVYIVTCDNSVFVGTFSDVAVYLQYTTGDMYHLAHTNHKATKSFVR